MFSRLYHRFYLFAQKRQSWVKRAKDPCFRTSRYLEMVRPYLTAFPAKHWPDPVLCLGPRNSLELQYLRVEGMKRVVGLDLFSTSPSDIKVGDMHDMPFPSDEFGLVWASHVLEHAKDPKVVFKEIVRVLKPGGYLMAAYPTDFTPNWHDRWDYGAAGTLLDYLPGSALLVAQRTQAGDSAEWAALYRVNCIG